MTSLSGLVRLGSGEITTINDLDAKGLIKYEMCEMTGKKRNGERKGVIHYQAVYIPSITKDGCCSLWNISKIAYLSRTKQHKEIKEIFA